MHKDNILEVKHLHKRFFSKGITVKAVTDVSFDVKPGETIGIVGESGCGKTTLGRCIVRAYEASEGEVLYRTRAGEEVDFLKVDKRKRKEIRRDIQMIFQDPYSSLDPRMSVNDIVGEPLDIQFPKMSAKERSERIIEQLHLRTQQHFEVLAVNRRLLPQRSQLTANRIRLAIGLTHDARRLRVGRCNDLLRVGLCTARGFIRTALRGNQRIPQRAFKIFHVGELIGRALEALAQLLIFFGKVVDECGKLVEVGVHLGVIIAAELEREFFFVNLVRGNHQRIFLSEAQWVMVSGTFPPR